MPIGTGFGTISGEPFAKTIKSYTTSGGIANGFLIPHAKALSGMQGTYCKMPAAAEKIFD